MVTARLDRAARRRPSPVSRLLHSLDRNTMTTTDPRIRDGRRMSRAAGIAVLVVILAVAAAIGFAAGRASAHTPSVNVTCSELRVTLDSYDASGRNTATVSVGEELAPTEEFGSTYSTTLPIAPGQRWSVAVTAHDDPEASRGWTFYRTGHAPECEPTTTPSTDPTTAPPTNSPEPSEPPTTDPTTNPTTAPPTDEPTSPEPTEDPTTPEPTDDPTPDPTDPPTSTPPTDDPSTPTEPTTDPTEPPTTAEPTTPAVPTPPTPAAPPSLIPPTSTEAPPTSTTVTDEPATPSSARELPETGNREALAILAIVAGVLVVAGVTALIVRRAVDR